MVFKSYGILVVVGKVGFIVVVFIVYGINVGYKFIMR